MYTHFIVETEQARVCILQKPISLLGYMQEMWRNYTTGVRGIYYIGYTTYPVQCTVHT